MGWPLSGFLQYKSKKQYLITVLLLFDFADEYSTQGQCSIWNGVSFLKGWIVLSLEKGSSFMRVGMLHQEGDHHAEKGDRVMTDIQCPFMRWMGSVYGRGSIHDRCIFMRWEGVYSWEVSFHEMGGVLFMRGVPSWDARGTIHERFPSQGRRGSIHKRCPSWGGGGLFMGGAPSQGGRGLFMRGSPSQGRWGLFIRGALSWGRRGLFIWAAL